MGLSGLVGAGANEGLEDILARQMLEQQQAEQMRARKAQEAMQQQQLGLATRRQDFDEKSYDEEGQQKALDDVRSRTKEFEERMRVSQDEEDKRDAAAKLEQELAALMGDPSIPDIDKRGVRLRKFGSTTAPHMTAEEQAAEDARRANQAGAEAEARARAEAKYRKPDAPPRPAVMTPGQKFQATQSLRKSFDMESRAAREVAMQLSQMQAGIGAARKGDMAAGSQAVLVTFQKILDPASVVRESEYARSSSGQALLSRIQGAVEQLRVGGASIPLEELERFVSLANTFAENQARAAMESKEQIEAVATEYGIDPTLVTRDIQAPGGAPAPSRGNDGMIRMQAPNGQIKDVPADQVEAFKAKGAKVVP